MEAISAAATLLDTGGGLATGLTCETWNSYAMTKYKQKRKGEEIKN
jgi:hypothetical protein